MFESYSNLEYGAKPVGAGLLAMASGQAMQGHWPYRQQAGSYRGIGTYPKKRFYRTSGSGSRILYHATYSAGRNINVSTVATTIPPIIA